MYPPKTFVSGEYFAFKRGDLSALFPLTSYAVKFCVSQFGSGTGTTSASQISLDAVESGSEYQITAGSTATSSWAVVKYQWTLLMTFGDMSLKCQKDIICLWQYFLNLSN